MTAKRIRLGKAEAHALILAGGGVLVTLRAIDLRLGNANIHSAVVLLNEGLREAERAHEERVQDLVEPTLGDA